MNAAHFADLEMMRLAVDAEQRRLAHERQEAFAAVDARSRAASPAARISGFRLVGERFGLMSEYDITGNGWPDLRDTLLIARPACSCGRESRVVDLVKPLLEGGSLFDLDNLAVFCPDCHSLRYRRPSMTGYTPRLSVRAVELCRRHMLDPVRLAFLHREDVHFAVRGVGITAEFMGERLRFNERTEAESWRIGVGERFTTRELRRTYSTRTQIYKIAKLVYSKSFARI